MTETGSDRLASRLGASRVVRMGERRPSGPLELLALRADVASRLQSSGGRPTDPAWDLNRQVPFSGENWRRLQELAQEIGADGRRVGAAQLAAILIEYGLDDVQFERWESVLAESRARPLITATAAAQAAAVSFRQVDTWRKDGLIKPALVREGRRLFTLDSVVRMVWLRSAHQSEAAKRPPLQLIADADLSGRYLVISEDRTVHVLTSQRDLSLLLAQPLAHTVIDQLPLRERLIGASTLEVKEDADEEQPKAV